MATSLRFEDVQTGMELPSVAFGPLTTQDLVRWAAASGDYNPIHYDKDIAHAQGLPTVVVHGPLKLALCATMLTEWIGPRGRLKRLGSSYRGMDFPGDTLTCGGQVMAKSVDENGEQCVDCEIWVENQRGERTTKGTARVSLP